MIFFPFVLNKLRLLLFDCCHFDNMCVVYQDMSYLLRQTQ